MEKRGGIEIAGSGFGHILKDGNSVTFTSTEAAGTFAQTLIKMVDAMAKDLSDLTGVPVARLIDDYITENELSLMISAFRTVLRKRGIKPQATTTRETINNIIKRNQEASLKPEECVPDKPFGKFDCETTWDKVSHRYVYRITYPKCANGPVFQITSDSNERDDYDTLCRKIRNREVQEYLARR